MILLGIVKHRWEGEVGLNTELSSLDTGETHKGYQVKRDRQRWEGQDECEERS